MAPLIPPIILLFDSSALLASRTRDWKEFSRLGECVVPEAVIEAMQSFGDHAPDPETERVAREFNRFYPTSGWKRSTTLADHPSLKPAEGHALSKRARLALEVMQCAHGLALRRPEGLVILVANDQPMLQRILGLGIANLCGLPLTALVQWDRSQRRPAVVTHHFQLMRATARSSPEPSGNIQSTTATSTGNRTAKRPTTVRPAVQDLTQSFHVPAKRSRILPTHRLFELFSNFLSLAVVLVVIGAIWRVAHPPSFNQFWRQLPFVHGTTSR